MHGRTILFILHTSGFSDSKWSKEWRHCNNKAVWKCQHCLWNWTHTKAALLWDLFSSVPTFPILMCFCCCPSPLLIPIDEQDFRNIFLSRPSLNNSNYSRKKSFSIVRLHSFEVLWAAYHPPTILISCLPADLVNVSPWSPWTSAWHDPTRATSRCTCQLGLVRSWVRH